MRKFLTSGALLSSVFSVVPLIRQTSTERRRWKIVLLWVAWGIGVAVAVASVLDDIDEARENELELTGK